MSMLSATVWFSFRHNTQKVYACVKNHLCQNYAPKFSIWHQGYQKRGGGVDIFSKNDDLLVCVNKMKA